MKERLALRKEIASRRPEFRRQEGHRYVRLAKTGWRKPRGLHSKMRRHYKYRPNIVSIGYRGPQDVRGLHPSGFKEVMIYNIGGLEEINAKKECGRIGHSVGYKKRLSIEKHADELGVRILNRVSR